MIKMKQCGYCPNYYPEDEFPRRKSTKTGYTNKCYECTRIWTRLNRAKKKAEDERYALEGGKETMSTVSFNASRIFLCQPKM